MTGWDSSSVTVRWDCSPGDTLTSFLVTVFHTNGSGHVLEERLHRQAAAQCRLTLGPLPPCSRVRLGLQAECRAQGTARRSPMLLSDGNSGTATLRLCLEHTHTRTALDLERAQCIIDPQNLR